MSLRTRFADAVKASPLARSFACNAGKITSITGIAAAGLLALNRTLLNGQPTADAMTLSGVALLGSSLALYPSAKLPWMKRVSGVLGAAYVGLLAADAWGKTGVSGILAGNALTTVACLAMIFERSAGAKDNEARPAPVTQKSGLQGTFSTAVEGFKSAPIFWTSVASAWMKAFMLPYGVMHGETYFLPAVAAGFAENIALGMTDNRVQRFFGLTPPSSVPAPPRTPA